MQGQIWSGLPREGQEDRQMLCGKAHQNQKSRAKGEGSQENTKIQKYEIISKNSIFAGGGGDQFVEKVFKPTHNPIHRSL